MQIIDERRDSPRERRQAIRLRERREKRVRAGQFDLRDLAPETYLLLAILWLVLVVEFMKELLK